VLEQEKMVERNPKFKDNRVHVAFYFISPTGHGLREMDIDFMMLLSNRVNVIPILAKADTMTEKEIARNKKAIMDDINHFNIPIYRFPYTGNDDDKEGKEQCEALREMLPFAIVGSNELYEEGDHIVRARKYPWGMVKVEDPEISDFVPLRSVLFGSHLQELCDITHEVLYEKYRTEKLQADLAHDEFAATGIPTQHLRFKRADKASLLQREAEKLRCQLHLERLENSAEGTILSNVGSDTIDNRRLVLALANTTDMEFPSYEDMNRKPDALQL
jgi:cell division control protein 11